MYTILEKERMTYMYYIIIHGVTKVMRWFNDFPNGVFFLNFNGQVPSQKIRKDSDLCAMGVNS